MHGLDFDTHKTICKCVTEKLGHVAHESIAFCILQSTCSCVNDEDVTMQPVHTDDCRGDMALSHSSHSWLGGLISTDCGVGR